MWPVGHAAVGYLCYSLGAEREWLEPPDALLVVVLGLGTQFPDLVDKPLAWYLGVWPGGRTVAHTLFVLVPLTVALVVVLDRWNAAALGLAFGIGAISHSLVDAVAVLWQGPDWWEFLVWPLLDDPGIGSETSYTILGQLRRDVQTPWFWFEYVVLAVALVRWRADGLPGVAWLRERRPERTAVQQ